MKETTSDKTHIGHTLIIALGITTLAILMLASIVGAAPFAYITNFGNSFPSVNSTVSVIDTATDTVTATIGVGCNP